MYRSKVDNIIYESNSIDNGRGLIGAVKYYVDGGANSKIIKIDNTKGYIEIPIFI